MSGPLDRLPTSPRVLLAALVGLVLVVALAQAVLGPDRQLSAYGDGPNDASEARLTMQQTGFPVGNTITSPHLLEGLEEPKRYLFVVVGVEAEYSDSEVDAITSFVRDGGHLVLADDFGHGNDVAAEFDVTFSKRILRDDDFRGNQSFVEVNTTIEGRNATLLTNVPTALNVGSGGGEVLARTSPGAYIDVNQNGREDEGDINDAFPVAYRTTLGDGDAVLLSDPGILTNQALQADDVDNREFFRSIAVTQLPNQGTVVFDESRHAAPLGLSIPLGAAGAAVSGTQDTVLGTVTFLALGGSIALAALLLRTPEAFSIHRQRLDELRTPDARPEERGRRLQALALKTVAGVHELRGDPEEVRQEAVRVVEDPELQTLLEADEPRVGSAEGQELLDRVDAYGTDQAQRQEVTA